MADNTVVAATVKVDTSLAAKQMSDLNKIISEQKKIWKDAEIGSKEYEDAQKKLGEAQTEYNTLAKQVNNSAENNGKAFGILKGKMGDLIPGFKGASEGASSFGKQLWTLAANPIMLLLTAIVIVLTTLYKAFTATDEGAQKFKGILDGLGAVVREFMQRANMLANAVVKIFSGDFKGAAEDASKSIDHFGDAMVDAFKRGKEASDLLDEVEDALRVLDIQYVAMNARLAKSKELLTDETASYGQKKKALQESGEEIDKYYKAKAALDEKEIQAIGKKYNVEKQLADYKSKGFENSAKEMDDFLQTLAIGKDGMEEIENTIKKSIEANAEYSAKQRQQNRAERALERAERANEKEYQKKLNELQNEQDISAQQEGYKKEKQALINKYNDEKDAFDQSLREKKLTQEQYDNLVSELERAHRLKLNDLKEKDRKTQEDAEKKFENDLNKIRLETQTAGIEDAREKEKEQLKITFAERYKQAEEAYKNDAKKLEQIKAALDKQQRAASDALQKKFDAEDNKKKQELDLKEIDNELKNKKLAFKIQRDLLNEKEKIEKAAFAEEIKAANGNALKLRDIQIRQTQNENENKEARKKIKKEEVDATVQAADAIANVLSGLADLAGKQTGAGKVLAIASATISMFTSAQKAYSAALEVPIIGLGLAPVAAGLAIASGIKNIQSIAAVEVPGGGASGGAVPSASAPIAPTQTSTALNAKSIQGVGNAAAQGVGRTFVLDSDIKSSGERQARLTRAARLG
jgi:hypothetical protein